MKWLPKNSKTKQSSIWFQALYEAAVNNDPFTAGRIYTVLVSGLQEGTDYTYQFEAQDAQGATATGEGAQQQSGPVVTTPAQGNDWLLFARKTGINDSSDIFVMKTDGSNLVNLTNSINSDDIRPRVSPDGSKILFSSDRDGDYELYLMDVTNNNLQQITNNAISDDL